MPVSLKDKVAIVVGASSGIGKATALMLADEGARVMASARRADRLESLKSDAAKRDGTLEVFAADCTKPDDMTRLAEASFNRFGNPNILIFCSGTNTPDRAMARMRPPIWDEIITTNLNGAYYATHAVLPGMREARDGHLVYVSSISGLAPDFSGAAYQASKRGMIGLGHAIRMEEKANGIRTTVVCPGWVNTDFVLHRPEKPDPEALKKALLPEDVAEAILACLRMHPRSVVTEISVAPLTI